MGSIATPQSRLREFTPDSYPPFPADAQPCIDLQTISLSALQAGDASEQARLLSICKDKGFFFLNVVDTDAQYLPYDAEDVVRLSEDFFSLPLEEKNKFPIFRKPRSLLGYKPAGFGKADAHGTKRDTAEFLNCGKDDVLDTPGRIFVDLPPMFLDPVNRDLLARFQITSHQIGLNVLSALAVQLGLPATAFDEMHRPDRPSECHARLLRGPPRMTSHEIEIATPGHTDFGSITMLFNWLGGLQVWSESNHGKFDNAIGSDLGPESGRQGQWLWVKPKPGHIIINLGDTAVKFTGGVLCAGRHRALPAPGEQSKYARYGLVYFVRPADDQVLKRFVGGEIPPLKDGEVEEELTSLQWSIKQTTGLMRGNAKA